MSRFRPVAAHCRVLAVRTVFVGSLFGLGVFSGCSNPTRVVLESNRRDGGACADDTGDGCATAKKDPARCSKDTPCPAGQECMAGDCVPVECKVHTECPTGMLCVRKDPAIVTGYCLPCSHAPAQCALTCTRDFTVKAFIRNGCPVCECAPPDECVTDADCKGLHCYAGNQCDDGCTAPKCCHGNRCEGDGCQGPPPSCAVAGCSGGLTCAGTCTPVCKCGGTGTGWTCVSECPDAVCMPQ